MSEFQVHVVRLEGQPDSGLTVWLSDGTFECCAHGHGRHFEPGEILRGPVYAFEPGVVRLSTDDPKIDRQQGLGPWNHWIVGKVESLSPPQVRVGSFVIEDVALPEDIEVGQLVEFGVQRLDA